MQIKNVGLNVGLNVALNKTEKKVVSLLIEDSEYTSDELAAKIGVTGECKQKVEVLLREKMYLNMLKVMIIGCPGAGKSTFARKLRDKTGLPLYHLDMIWHKPDRTNISKEEFDKKVSEIVQRDRWIIDGNYQRTLEMRLGECDTVFLMDYPLDVCLAGAESRIGRQRDDLPWLETEFDEEFRQWIIDFPQNELPEIYELVNKYKDEKNIVIFKSREETDDYLQRMSG